MSMGMSISVSVHQPKVDGARVQPIPSGAITVNMASDTSATALDLYLYGDYATAFVVDLIEAINAKKPGFRTGIILALEGTDVEEGEFQQ